MFESFFKKTAIYLQMHCKNPLSSKCWINTVVQNSHFQVSIQNDMKLLQDSET